MTTIGKDIYWVGSIDWDLRNFHGYSTPYGSNYKAYLLVDEQPTLIDTVKHYGYEEMLQRIKEVIDPSKISYIISNHAEMDHSGCIAALLQLCPKAEVVCSPKGESGLKRHFLSAGSQAKKEWRFKVVNTGDVLNLGRRRLRFYLMPMVHWPDSMASYSEQDSILFPNDAFGQHYASSQRYVDEVGLELALREAAKYYANIVLPYGAQTLKVLDMLGKLPLSMICPSHGLIWRKKEDIEKIIASYSGWARHQTNRQVVIVYDTMWHSTQKMAQYLYEIIEHENIAVKLINLKTTDISDVMTDIMQARVVMLGSPILNNRMLPSIAGLLMYMKGLKPVKRFGFTFGSYGWSVAGFKEVEDSLKDAGLELLGPGVYAQFVPDDQALAGLKKIVPAVKALITKEQV